MTSVPVFKITLKKDSSVLIMVHSDTLKWQWGISNTLRLFLFINPMNALHAALKNLLPGRLVHEILVVGHRLGNM